MAENIIIFGAGFIGVLLGWALGYFMRPPQTDPDWREVAKSWRETAEKWRDLYERNK